MKQSMKQAWDTLHQDWKRLQGYHLRDMFRTNPDRFEKFSFGLDDLLIDFSKERTDAKALNNLLSLARAANIEAKRDAMFAGEPVNTTENRAALHIALRARRDDNYRVEGQKTADLVEPVLEQFLKFADDVRTGRVTGSRGMPFTDVVNIGIGGSDLGPVMATRALYPYATNGPHLHFVSNVDGAHFCDIARHLNPETTLFLIASKSFTTQETMANAETAKKWVVEALGITAVRSHFAAISTNLDATKTFGIPSDRVFGFWDWIGGRYSLTSAIGLSLAIAIGRENFQAFLNGFRVMDQHFKTTPLEENLPVLLALIGIWRRNIMGCPTVALIPYSQRLEHLAAYIQQLDMESNGKGVTQDGQKTPIVTAPIIWGTPGTNAQHSFFQLIHQGTEPIPVDFILPACPQSELDGHHDLLTAHFLAQSQALAFGKTKVEVCTEMLAANETDARIKQLTPHRTFPGNRPSTSIIIKDLSPGNLGRLIALYEHKIFVQGVIWNINSFDQWGVELGKVLADQIAPLLSPSADLTDVNSSTRGLIERIRRLRGDV